MKIYESDIHVSWLNKKSNETKFIWIGLKIREKSLFGNQQNFATKFGQNDKNFDS